MRKNNYVIFALVCVIFIAPVLFTGCETLDQIGDKVSGIFDGGKKAEKSESSESVADKGEKISKPKASSVKPDFSKAVKTASYKLPDSYDTAYSYRTDSADKTISTFIKSKNVDSLRSTNPDGYVKTVVAKINEIGGNDFERVKMAHDAICVLVSYDAKNFWAGTVPDQSWQNVVKTKTAVCEGYANLFQKFCTELKINSQKVSGYARGVGTNISTEKSISSNHAWNIVCIDGSWYVIDCTWDSGYMSGKSSVQSYTTDWLFLKPEYSIYTHFPSEAKNQLIQPPLTLNEFSFLPDFRPKLFEITGDSLLSVKKTNPADDIYELEYKVKEGYSLSWTANMVGGNELKNRIWTENDGNNGTTSFSFPEPDVYMITVYYWKDGAKSGHSCGQFLFNAFSGSDVTYATSYPTKSKSAKLITPIQSPLKAGETVLFEVFCEDRPFVAVIAGKNFIQLENDGTGTFTGEIEIPAGTKRISIGLATKQTGSYETLAVFEVK